ncbi:MAG: hypothetical protein KA236_15650 [Verrucomicrobia bacterium]|jgi:hypothetical protein|nr:hypothetical protein [Verrucomicrobiota bacterium]
MTTRISKKSKKSRNKGNKKIPSAVEVKEIPIRWRHSPYILPDETPKLLEKSPSPATRYRDLAAAAARERDEVALRIKKLEARLQSDLAKRDKIDPDLAKMLKAQRDEQSKKLKLKLKSIKGHKDLLSPEELMRLHIDLADLRTKSKSLPTQEAEYRARAKRWQRLESEPDKVASKLFARLNFDKFEDFAMVRYLAKTHPEAVAVLGWCTRQFLMPLITTATEGNLTAAAELANISSCATRAVWQLSWQQPDLFRRVATRALDWPVMVSCKRNFYQSPYKLLELLQQGTESSVHLQPGSKWDRHDITGKVAWSLWEYVRDCRDLALAAKAASSWNIKLDNFLDSAGKLPEFSAESVKQWWALAKVALEETYPDSAANAILKSVGRLKRSDAAGRRLPPSELRRAINRDLQGRFDSFAGVHKGT